MREKIGTSIDRYLLSEARLLALQKNKRLNEIIEEALARYLDQEKNKKNGSFVRATRGVIPATPELVKNILEEESFLDV
ncbi:MAG: hypothetical protein IMW93_07370 [Thermoanaerobacteraceae bacterium]|nr:hypothetical protein [Thermoanaerobacteraceae bacterium]